MNWLLHRWVWQLDAPLFIGMPPAGTLNRCRLYVPARAIWAAITAHLARDRSRNFPDYDNTGRQIGEKTRFTYLFPAEHLGGQWLTWLPIFEPEKGPSWYREGNGTPQKTVLSARAFRHRLVETRPGTAIEASSHSVADATLRETECISMHWRMEDSGETRRVGLVGYAFFRDDDKIADDISKITSLSLGGDTRYGLGRIHRTGWTYAYDVFGAHANLYTDTPCVRSHTILAHAFQHDGGPKIAGNLERLVGWDSTGDSGPNAFDDRPMWAPGSTTARDSIPQWEITRSGYWRLKTGEMIAP